jgi:hypothetical protein
MKQGEIFGSLWLLPCTKSYSTFLVPHAGS